MANGLSWGPVRGVAGPGALSRPSMPAPGRLEETLREALVRRWVIGLVPATLIGVALLSMVGNPHPAAAQQGDRLAVVSGYFDAQNRVDVDESLSAFADNAVFIGVQATGGCAQQTPC